MTAIDDLETVLSRAGIQIVARVAITAAATDLAGRAADGRMILLRLRNHPTRRDHVELKAMLAQGDFERAILVHRDRHEGEPRDGIESWWIGDIDGLVASLAQEHAAP